jgi:hypothetical protein
VAQLRLVRRMPPDLYVVRLSVAVSFAVANLYLFGLWCFASMRTGLRFFWLLAIASGASLLEGIFTVLLAYDFAGWEQFFGRQLFVISYEVFLSLQPVISLAALVGCTMFVRWVLRERPQASNQSLEPTAGRRDTHI